MIFKPPLERATLIKRYKRFLADVVTQDGKTTTIHCPNTGAMTGCDIPGSTVWMQRSANPKRKYPYSWELVEVTDGTLVGINTGRSNALVGEAIAGGAVSGWDPDWPRRAEVSFGEERSRVDWLLEPPNDKPWYVEVKNVTAAVDGGIAAFPDAVTTRGTRHLRELTRLVSSGVANAALVFCVQRSDVVKVRPAHEIDPDYAAALRVADEAGVRVLALRARISQEQSFLDTAIDVLV